jgi:hypothetical protein
VRVRQPRQDLPFAPEALGPRVPQQRQVQQLDGHRAFEAAVFAPRAPHAAAATLADRGFQHVGAQALSGQRGLVLRGHRLGDGAGQKALRERACPSAASICRSTSASSGMAIASAANRAWRWSSSRSIISSNNGLMAAHRVGSILLMV